MGKRDGDKERWEVFQRVGWFSLVFCSTTSQVRCFFRWDGCGMVGWQVRCQICKREQHSEESLMSASCSSTSTVQHDVKGLYIVYGGVRPRPVVLQHLLQLEPKRWKSNLQKASALQPLSPTIPLVAGDPTVASGQSSVLITDEQIQRRSKSLVCVELCPKDKEKRIPTNQAEKLLFGCSPARNKQSFVALPPKSC